mmetsp:Transcript_12635/g.50511  ORF Transcript_12635/g.50511 Transcript_12635/m.50511 type:complete len:201 (+) Transcript_12635:506-1108(+)
MGHLRPLQALPHPLCLRARSEIRTAGAIVLFVAPRVAYGGEHQEQVREEGEDSAEGSGDDSVLRDAGGRAGRRLLRGLCAGAAVGRGVEQALCPPPLAAERAPPPAGGCGVGAGGQQDRAAHRGRPHARRYPRRCGNAHWPGPVAAGRRVRHLSALRRRVQDHCQKAPLQILRQRRLPVLLPPLDAPPRPRRARRLPPLL